MLNNIEEKVKNVENELKSLNKKFQVEDEEM